MYNSFLVHKLRSILPNHLKHEGKEWVLEVGKLFGSFRVKPSIFIAGIKKGGTTSLYNYLVQHPLILANLQKEPHYFDYYYDKGEKWYLANFPFKPIFEQSKYITCDATPTYMYSVDAIERIQKFNPESKIIFLLRNPVYRAYSEYQYSFKVDNIKNKAAFPSFEARIQMELEWLQNNIHIINQPGSQPIMKKYAPYIGSGLYVVFLREWFKHFSRKQLYITSSEHFFNDTASVLSEIVEFLKLPPHSFQNLEVFNQNTYKLNIEPDTLNALQSFFKPYNDELEELTGLKTGWE